MSCIPRYFILCRNCEWEFTHDLAVCLLLVYRNAAVNSAVNPSGLGLFLVGRLLIAVSTSDLVIGLFREFGFFLV